MLDFRNNPYYKILASPRALAGPIPTTLHHLNPYSAEIVLYIPLIPKGFEF